MAATTIEKALEVEAAGGEGWTGGLHRRWTIAVDRFIGAIVEPIVALIIVVEIAILASGVFSRYVLHNALTWTDELATFLFLWMSMLGAVVAYRRGEHMRLNAVVRAVSAGTRRWLDVIATVVVALFCIELVPPSSVFYELETVDFSPSLGFPRSLEVAAILTGLTLILLLAIVRLIDSEIKRVITVVAFAALATGVALLAHALNPTQAVLGGFGNINLVLFFVVVVGACVAVGVPIAFAFGFGTVSYLALATTSPLSTVVGRMSEGVSNLVLLAIRCSSSWACSSLTPGSRAGWSTRSQAWSDTTAAA